MILFTDFGPSGLYTGQMLAYLAERVPSVPVIDWLDDAPRQNPKAAAYLLAAYSAVFPAGSVFLAVVDPGVGSDRPPAAVSAGGKWFVGPANGLFELIRRRTPDAAAHEITWRPDRLSKTFHGRDLFAPVAGSLAAGESVEMEQRPPGWARRPDWPDDLAEIVYIDGFGNAITGIRASTLDSEIELTVKRRYVGHAETYSRVPPGEPFWYENSNGLVEIAVNQGSAAERFGLGIGSPVGLGG